MPSSQAAITLRHLGTHHAHLQQAGVTQAVCAPIERPTRLEACRFGLEPLLKEKGENAMMTQMTKKRAMVLGGMLAIALAYPITQIAGWLANRFVATAMDALRDQNKQITLVVGKVLTINIDGKAVRAIGSDICPGQQGPTMRLMFGETVDAGQPECIVVEPTTKKVKVTLAAHGQPLRSEEWAVERDADRVAFRRPNGSPVIVSDN